jgi:hypothetical protein
MALNNGTRKERSEPFSVYAVLAAAVVGGLIGVVMALAFAPLVISGEARIDNLSRTPGPTPAPTPSTSAAAVRVAVTRLARAALGYTTSGQQRVTGVAVSPMTLSVGAQTVLYNTTITFALNPNPFGPGSNVGSAREDVFLILKALYSHSLPLNRVSLRGTFQFPKTTRSRLVLVAGSNLAVEGTFTPWNKAPRSLEKKVWAALRPHWISPVFVNFHAPRA